MLERIKELKETRDKINTEISMLESSKSLVDRPRSPQPTQQLGEGYATREKTPEEILDDLFTYHPVPDEATQLKYEIVRDAAKHLALVIWKSCPYGPDRTAAIRKLRETVMTANAAIALKGLSV